MAHGQGGAEIASERSSTLTCNHEAPILFSPVCVTGEITHTLKAEGFDASEDGTWRGQPIICCHGKQDPCTSADTAFALGRNSGQENAIAFSCKDYGGDAGAISPTLRSMGSDGSHANAGGQVAVCFAENSRAEVRLEGGDGQRTGALSTGGGKPGQGTPMVAVAVALRGREGGATAELGDEVGNCLRAIGGGVDKAHVLAPVSYSTKLHNTSSNQAGKLYREYTVGLDVNSPPPALITAMQVRRLTPLECERLQGFPTNYTLIPWRKKPAADCPDGPRYKALGNSWAVPNVRWIGRRIDAAIKQADQGGKK